MRAAAILTTIAACLAVTVLWAAPEPARVVAVGDIHGDVSAFASILNRAGLVDAERRWTGGRAILVQTGDYVDRGPDIRAVLDLLMSLEDQARAAGGRVHVIMGNHEAMNAMGDLRYVSPEAFASFADTKSEQRRESAWKAYVRLAEKRRRALERASETMEVPPIFQPTSREAWMKAHPPGYLEYRDAFGPDGRYGRWIRRRPVAVRVGDTIFLHGGLDPDIDYRALDHATERARTELTYYDRLRDVMVRDGLALPYFSFSELIEAGRAELARVAAESPENPEAVAGHRLAEVLRIGTWSIIAANGPLWYRGFATWTDEEGGPLVDRLQQRYGSVRFVVGHTQPEGFRVTARFDNRVFLIDTGMSSVYEGGRASALEIAEGQYVALTMDERLVIVGGDEGGKTQE